MRWLVWGIVAVCCAFGTSAIGQARAFMASDLQSMPEFHRLVDQIDREPRWDSDPAVVVNYMARLGHALGRQALVVGDDPERNRVFSALVREFEKAAWIYDMIYGQDGKVFTAFRQGLLGTAGGSVSTPVRSIFTAAGDPITWGVTPPPPDQTGAGDPPPQPTPPTAGPLDGNYVVEQDCPYMPFKMRHFVQVTGTTVTVQVENYNCDEGVEAQVILSGGRVFTYEDAPGRAEVAANPNAGYPGMISGRGHIARAGETRDISGNDWYLTTQDRPDDLVALVFTRIRWRRVAAPLTASRFGASHRQRFRLYAPRSCA